MGPTTGSTARPRVADELELRIDSLAQGGRGVARRNGYVVFVAGALPGDTVRATVTKSKRNYAEARATEIVSPAAERVPDRCTHGGEPCPGAPWQGLPYEEQLRHKAEQLDEALRRLGGLDGFELEPIEPAERQWRYRNKLEYSFGAGDGGSPPGRPCPCGGGCCGRGSCAATLVANPHTNTRTSTIPLSLFFIALLPRQNCGSVLEFERADSMQAAAPSQNKPGTTIRCTVCLRKVICLPTRTSRPQSR